MKKIAMPLTNGMLSAHFGHCQNFGIYTVENNQMVKFEQVVPPPHEPGAYPKWLHELGVELIVAGGMGPKAVQLFSKNGIDIHAGTPGDAPEKVMGDYLSHSLNSEKPSCHHEHEHSPAHSTSHSGQCQQGGHQHGCNHADGTHERKKSAQNG
jgi:predicted Fe-Mo cluster-binding NifX family protein